MQWQCRQEIEDALWAAARELLSAGALDRKRVVHAVKQRSALYTTERDELELFAGDAAPEHDLAARALFFTVADVPKIGLALRELAAADALPAGRPWRILDLGAGAGAMGLGVLSHFATLGGPAPALQIDAVDQDRRALAIYHRALDKLGGVDFRVHDQRLADHSLGGPYDFVVAGTVLNEIGEDASRRLLLRAMESLTEDGAAILIEPALRETARALHRLRDTLVDAGYFVVAPCVRQAPSCPALEDERDWCHEDRPAQLPQRARQIAQATGLRDTAIKFSYLVLRRQPAALARPEAEQQAWRVVSRPQKSKPGRECFVCGEPGRVRLRLLKRNRNVENRGFERARRGDVLLLPSRDAAVSPVDIRKGEPVEVLRFDQD
jgi:SAM-dependent methyltransferase